MGRFRNPFDLGYLGNLLDFWTRAGRIESNPYHYTQLYQGKQPDARAGVVLVGRGAAPRRLDVSVAGRGGTFGPPKAWMSRGGPSEI